MNSATIDRNTKASDNGKFCEDYAKRMIPGLEWVGGLCDALWNGHPVDIKGCEAWYSREDRGGKRRAGRVTLEPEQKAEMEKGDGLYFVVVHIGELVINSFFVPAVRVPNSKQVSWTSMRSFAEAV